MQALVEIGPSIYIYETLKCNIIYWIKVFLKSLFVVSFNDLFITIQYAVFSKSLRTSYVSYTYIIILR